MAKLHKDAALILSWMKDPVKFVNEALSFPRRGYKLSKQQEEGLRELGDLAMAKYRASNKDPAAQAALSDRDKELARKIGISIMAGRGVGKDGFAAMAILWFLCCFSHSFIPCTAPTEKQLKSILWSEIHKWHRDSDLEKWGWLEFQSEKIYHIGGNKGKEWFAFPKTANVKGSYEEQAETLSGMHEDNMMFVVDEASGLPDAVFKPIEGTMTGKCNIALMIFNPTRAHGFAVESHRRFREDWITLHWNAEDSELVSRESIERMAKKYGRDSNAYRITVLGLPPSSANNELIPWDWVMDAVDRDITPHDDDPLFAGLDVGAGGDPSAIVHRRGGKVEEINEFSSKNTMEVTGWAVGEVAQKEDDAIAIDVVGLGNGVYNRMVEVRRGHYRVFPVDARRTPRNKERFLNVRAELYWKLREQFEQGTISIPNDAALIAELSTIRYEPAKSDGRLKIESKLDMKKRGVESPNKADALACTYIIPEQAFRAPVEDKYERNAVKQDIHAGWMGA